MDLQLEVAKNLFATDVKITYAYPDSVIRPADFGEIILEQYKLSSCPDVDGLLKALAKKSNRVAVMKAQRYSSALCIALLASRGYCITSMELKGVPDTTIEVCWESLNNIYISVDNPLKSWLKDIIGDRDYIKYGAQFCQHRFLHSTLETIGSKIHTAPSFKIVSRADSFMPPTMLDRDDCIYSSLSSHFRHEARDISDNTQ
jgi:hypothetical protein